MEDNKLNENSFIINKLINNNRYSNNTKILFIKILSNMIDKDTIFKILTENNNDETILNNLRKLIKPYDVYNEKHNIKKANQRWYNIKNFIKIKVNSILDYGGNIGDTVYAFGKILNLSKENINVVDINEWAGFKWEPRKDITFTHFDNIKNIKDKSIDLITIFHTLHHIKKKRYNYILENLHRILSDNGVIVLYEHNNENPNIKNIVDLEHCIYDVVVSQNSTYKEFNDNFYGEYYNINEWNDIFSKYFKKYYKIELHNVNNSFYMFFTKNNN